MPFAIPHIYIINLVIPRSRCYHFKSTNTRESRNSEFAIVNQILTRSGERTAPVLQRTRPTLQIGREINWPDVFAIFVRWCCERCIAKSWTMQKVTSELWAVKAGIVAVIGSTHVVTHWNVYREDLHMYVYRILIIKELSNHFVNDREKDTR